MRAMREKLAGNDIAKLQLQIEQWNSEKNLNNAEIRIKRWWILRNSTNC